MTKTTEIGTAADAPLGAVARYALLVGPLLSMIDSSIVNVAVPSIARDLKVTDLSSIQWVVSG